MQQKNVTQRTGPRPLWLHLNAGAAMMAAASENEDMLMASTDILQSAMHGVKAYHESAVLPFRREMVSVGNRNNTHLLTAQKWQGDKNDVVILIPSLINGWHIFDIEEEFSFAAYMHAQNFKPLIIDWAEPHEENISLNDYIQLHLKPLIDQVIEEGYNIKGLVGYCMGGTIIAALLSAFPALKDKIGKAVLIASPWDFSYQSVEQSTRLQTMAIQSYAMASPVPTDFVQSLFWAIDPLQIIKKFRRFPNVKNETRFVRVEDWLNEGRAVSLSVIQTCLFDWYRENKVSTGQWVINGEVVTDKNLPQDTLIVAANSDNLVPQASIDPLVGQRKLITVDTGHIGLMASDKAVEFAWKPIADFLK